MSAATLWSSRGEIVKNNWLLLIGLLAIIIPTMAFVARESWSTEQGAHGPIVVATGLWLLARQWPSIAHVIRPGRTIVLAIAMPLLLAVYVLSRITQIVEIEGYLMYAIVLLSLYSVAGSAALKVLWFPLFYLAFALPPPDTLVAAVTQPLKIWISYLAIEVLYAAGLPIAGAGVTIQVGQFQLLVAAACSGLNSLLSLSAISLFYVYLRHQMNWGYALVLMLAIVPVAIFANFVRVLILILLTYYFGEAAAQGFLHNFAGITMFITALLSIFAIDLILEPLWRRVTKGKAVHV